MLKSIRVAVVLFIGAALLPVAGSSAYYDCIQHACRPGVRFLVDTFTLLGDPATQLNLTLVPWSNHVYLPVRQRAPE